MQSVLWTYVLLSISPIIECLKNDQSRPHTGMEQRPRKHPYIVALVDNYKGYLIRICTGTLIRHEYVLSAGHCMSDRLDYVQFGDMHFPPSRTQKKRRVLQMKRHPGYMKTKKSLWANDIGLLRVSAIDLRIYGELAPQNYKLEQGHLVTIAGYGKNGFENQTYEIKNSQPLLAGEGTLLECFNEITDKMMRGFLHTYLCVSPKPYNYIHHITNGDAGGPLIYDDMVVGVASQVYTKKAITIYMAIAPYWSWIRQVAFHEGLELN